jgi:CelD/BcsL family acetyltransferase involved in cellulose biosynthesis
MKFDLLKLDDLTPDVRARWRALQSAHRDYASPFLSLDFALAVAAQRSDVRVAILHHKGAPAGFLPVHVRRGAFLRPIGAPFSDWQGPVLAADAPFDPAGALKACKADAIRFTGLIDPFNRFGGYQSIKRASWLIDLSAGEEAYRRDIHAVYAKHINNTKRCERKAAREIGPVRFTFHTPDHAILDTLIQWKRHQFAATARHDVLSAAWSRAMLHTLLDWRGDIGVVMSTLHFGDRLAAVEYYLRNGPLLHAWIASYDRTLANYAPGHILTDQMISAAKDQGVTRIDFGAGNDAYKAKWCLDSHPVLETVVHAQTAAGRARASASRAMRAVAPAIGLGGEISERVQRRLDQIIAADVTWLRAAASLMRTSTLIGQSTRLALESTKHTG